jgi:adenine phosphoribosyltransferase
MSLPPRNALGEVLAARLRDVPDFPTPGIVFKDITPVLADAALMRAVIERMAAPHQGQGITHVVAMESRGFLFGMPIALELGAAFVPARKPGKLPWKTERITYTLEYRSDTLEMHADALTPGSRVLVVDDVLATGGTALAACHLIERLGGNVQGVSVAVELTFLDGRKTLSHRPVDSVCAF